MGGEGEVVEAVVLEGVGTTDLVQTVTLGRQQLVVTLGRLQVVTLGRLQVVSVVVDRREGVGSVVEARAVEGVGLVEVEVGVGNSLARAEGVVGLEEVVVADLEGVVADLEGVGPEEEGEVVREDQEGFREVIKFELDPTHDKRDLRVVR